MVYFLVKTRLRAHQRVGLFVIDSGHLHRFAAEKVRMSTASAEAQLILLVNVTVPAGGHRYIRRLSETLTPVEQKSIVRRAVAEA